ncbi:helix-turn-helix domain-containing protein [Streptomyces xanthophaeus]|uniref:helix-turn-helix domain-containing protein n=1 Tax=Streptomyces xanthophaeus TaxID=67385 RepID=UPI00233EE3A6|nr:helix-turn-helix domain-containing protein [Streptomyces xanthophaeus]
MKKAAYGHKTPHQSRVRSQIGLLAARGRSNARIATEVGVHVDTVRTWRGRFAGGGLPALADPRRSGRPARFTPVQVAQAQGPGLTARPAQRSHRSDRPRHSCADLPVRLRRLGNAHPCGPRVPGRPGPVRPVASARHGGGTGTTGRAGARTCIRGGSLSGAGTPVSEVSPEPPGKRSSGLTPGRAPLPANPPGPDRAARTAYRSATSRRQTHPLKTRAVPRPAA